MEPMNAFLTTHRQEFKNFVDSVCAVSSDQVTSAIPPSYATPITILSRLPATSREGFPSLPYLIDQARECAGLVELWLDARHEIDRSFVWSDELRRFDILCENLRSRAKDCLNQAEQAERPSGTLEPKWEELVEQMERKAKSREEAEHSSPGTPFLQKTSNTVNSSTSSLADSYFSRNARPRGRPAYGSGSGSKTMNDAVRSRDEVDVDEDLDGEETDTPPGSSSAVWDPGVRQRTPSANRTYTDLHSHTHPDDDVRHDVSLGSSTFSLDASNRACAGSTEPISPLSGPEDFPTTGRSLYSLGTNTTVSATKPYKHLTKVPHHSKSVSIEGGTDNSRRHKKETRQKSMYRLPSQNSSSHNTGEVVNSPRGGGSRDGHGKHLFGDFGSFFGKKAKERERDGYGR